MCIRDSTKPVNVGKLFNKLVVLARGILAVREREHYRCLLAQYKLLFDQSAIVCKFDAVSYTHLDVYKRQG